MGRILEGIFPSLERKRLDRQAQVLVDTARLLAIPLQSEMLEKFYPDLSWLEPRLELGPYEYLPENWEFSITVACVGTALMIGSTRISLPYQPAVSQTVVKHLNSWNPHGHKALKDDDRFVTERIAVRGTEPHTVIGEWVVRKVKKKPPNKKDLDAASLIGNFLIISYAGWWDG